MKFFLLLSLLILPSSAFADTLAYANDTGDDASYAIDATTVYYGQTFITDSSNLILSTISLFGKRFGTGGGTCTLHVTAVDGSHKPTGSDISSGTWDDTTLSTSDAWFSVDVSNYTLTALTEYAIYISCAGVDGSNGFSARGDSSDTFPYILWSTNSGSTWATDANQSLMIRVYTTSVAPPDPAPEWATSTPLTLDDIGFLLGIFLVLAWFFVLHFIYKEVFHV